MRHYRKWTRGEEMAVWAMRLWTDMSLREISAAIGRGQSSLNSYLTTRALRTNGWRERIWRRLNDGEPY